MRESYRSYKRDKYFVKKNLISTSEELTPSGRYRLVIRKYKTPGWQYSRGTVYSVATGKEVCDIKRNFYTFTHTFINKGGQEWLISGRSYMSQTIVNLDTGKSYEPPGDQYDPAAFCWVSAWLSPDEKILVVDGCHWACPYEFRFFDFSDPSKGWPQLEIDGDWVELDNKEPIFNPDGTITVYQTKRVHKELKKDYDEISDKLPYKDWINPDLWDTVTLSTRTFKIDGHKLIKVDEWISEEEQKKRDDNKKYNDEHDKWEKEFKSSDPLYLKYRELLKSTKGLKPKDYESYGTTHKNWCPTFTGSETRWCRRVHVTDKLSIHVEWGVKTGPIKVESWREVRGQKNKEVKTQFFDHSVEGMQKAFNLVSEIVGE